VIGLVVVVTAVWAGGRRERRPAQSRGWAAAWRSPQPLRQTNTDREPAIPSVAGLLLGSGHHRQPPARTLLDV